MLGVPSVLKTPQFWSKKSSLSYALRPVSWLYIKASNWRASRIESTKVSMPVVCVGNFVMGGAGKTPTVIALADILKQQGHTPHILSRGYGSYVKDVVRVDPERHSYLHVGDEPLLLSRVAPTWVGADRVESAKAAIQAGASILLMDDGLQNPSLFKDFSIVVVDSIQGLGNRHVFPAGPLREPIQQGLKRAQAVIFIGGSIPLENTIKTDVFHATLTCKTEDLPQRVVGFAGLGYPEKFRQTLGRCHFDVCEFITFADHHPYTMTDAQRLFKIADLHEAALITTEKDYMRFPAEHKPLVKTLPIRLEFKELEELSELFKKKFPAS
jgi:tetraacyldisaccharide 4'-kinase